MKVISKVLAAFMILCLVSSVFAQAADETERRAKPVLSNNIYRPMNKAQEAIQNEDYTTALSVLDELLARGDRLVGYDRAKTLHLKTIVYIRQENFAAAVTTCKEAIALKALEFATEQDLRYTLVRMLFVLERYDEALEVLEAWIEETEELDADVAFTAAQLYLTVENLDQAQYYAEQGMALHQADTTSAPRENWYRLLLSIYGQQKNYAKAAVVAEQTLSLWPNKIEYYHQLSGLYQQLERQKDAWAILSIAYHNQLLSRSDDFVRLLQMHRFFGYPYRGATIFAAAMEAEQVEKNEEHWENLANAWLQSRQWQQAETALIEAARISDSGKHWLRLCQTAFQNERWQQSEQYCTNALNKGGLGKDRATTWQLLAMIHYSTDNYADAVPYFEKCAREAGTKKDCDDWLAHVNNLIARSENERAMAAKQARLAEERRRNRDNMIDEALLMTE